LVPHVPAVLVASPVRAGSCAHVAEPLRFENAGWVHASPDVLEDETNVFAPQVNDPSVRAPVPVL
jgi:hypothetical protein